MLIWTDPLRYDMRAIDYSPDGRTLATGLMNGVVMLLDASNLKTLKVY